MKIFKSLVYFLVCIFPLSLAQCGSNQTAQTTEETQTTPDMELQHPTFARALVIHHSWIAGVKGGGSGIDMTFDWKALPENIVMLDAYFRGNKAKINAGPQNYTAKFTTSNNRGRDIIMHEDSAQEAVNTPATDVATFPFPLSDKQVGVVYEENGRLKYTILSNLKETETIAYPTAPPKEGGYE